MKKQSSERGAIFNALQNSFYPNRYVIPKVYYYDDLGRQRTIDFAIIPKEPDIPRVAIIIQPNTTGSSNSYKEYMQRETELAIDLLCQQDWIPVIFHREDLMFRFRDIEEQLKEIVYQYESYRSVFSELAQKSNVRSYYRFYLNSCLHETRVAQTM